MDTISASDEENLFLTLASLQPEERASFFDRECAGRPALRSRLEPLRLPADCALSPSPRVWCDVASSRSLFQRCGPLRRIRRMRHLMSNESYATGHDVAPAAPRFPPTRWSLVAQARADDSASVRAALTELCQHYWHPIYAFLRRAGFAQHDAEDATQGFFASLLAREVFARVAPEGGKLRTFLLASLKHHLANERRAAGRQKRGGGAVVISMDAEESERQLEGEMVDRETPEHAFDRAWALTLLGRALTAVEEEYADAGKAALFAALRPQLVEASASAGFAALGAQLAMSEGAVRVAAHRLRARYREVLVREVADTVEGPAALGAEFDFLLRALG